MKDVLELLHGDLWPGDRVANCSGISEDFVVIAALEGLVAKKVDGLVFYACDVLLGLDVLETVRLVPTGRKDVKGNLASDGVAGRVRKYRDTELSHLDVTYVRP